MSGETVSKPSMLDQRLEKMRTINIKQLLHCVVTVSRLSPDLADKRDIGYHYEKLFKSCHSKYQGDGPTGILLLYPQHCLHFVEAPIEILNSVIADLNQLNRKSSLLVDSRLITFATGLEQRFYPQWCYRVLHMSSLPKGESYQTNEPIEQTVASSMERLYKLGAQLSKLHTLELKRTMDALPDKLPDLLLQQDVLEYLVSNNDLNTAQEYLSRYCTYQNIVLDGELVWPMPVRLFPYD